MQLTSLTPYFLVILAACSIGTSPREFLPAVMPAGVAATLRLMGDDSDLVGELVAVSDSALVLVVPSSGLTLVGYSTIYRGKFHQVGTLIWNGKLPPSARERLRLVSRYPQGMTPELTTALLAALGQTRLLVR